MTTAPGIYIQDGLLFGWAVVSEIDGEPVYWGDGNTYVPSGQPLLKASMNYAVNFDAEILVNHQGKSVGKLVFAFPVNDEIAKAMGISSRVSGLLVGIKPDAATLAKFTSGELTGLSPHVSGTAEVTVEHIDG